MTTARVLLDTNVIILHLSGKRPLSFSFGDVAVSAVTVFELLQYPGMSPEEDEGLRSLLRACEIEIIGRSTAERAALLARTYKGDAFDLLIAATAIENRLPLLTYNTRHFKRIPGLQLEKVR